MKGKKVNFKSLIISEVKSISERENLNLFLKEEVNEPQSIDIDKDFEEVNPMEFAEEAKKAKTLSEEVSRMKELLDFNNPLLKK
tara:strand:+ start:727 stop:978 length:252 start_codon:yes stop_codon:yes gene_type:complete